MQTTSTDTTTDTLAVDTVRVLAMDAIERAGDGHPGTAMALAPAAYVLWSQFLRFDPADPDWPDRDRFVLSVGHASVLQHIILHLTGYDLGIDDLKSQRQLGSRTPGHPERGHTPGVETTTGPLGQGVGNAVGFAIAERLLADRAGSDLVSHRTWVFAGDGDLMEGVSGEASSLAGHLGLDKLTVLYDDNRITIDGGTDLTFSEDVGARYESYGWHVQHIEDANDRDAIAAAYAAAVAETERPSLIRLRSVIAWGAPKKSGTSSAHGSALGADEVAATKTFYGWDPEATFVVPEGVPERWRQRVPEHQAERQAWESRAQARAEHDPDIVANLRSTTGGVLPDGWDDDLDGLFDDAGAMATRKASSKVIQTVAARVPGLVGGSADLAGSNLTTIEGGGDLSRDGVGRNIHFGVREHAMGAIANGLAAHGGLHPFVATFLVFSDYMRPSVRLAALMSLPVVYVWTHDSIGLGGDGPTHQPVEHLASLRAMPNLEVIRPADGPETVEAWRAALARTDGPTALALSRQSVPALDREELAPAAALARGGYVLREADSGSPQLILIASGSEVGLAVDAAVRLEAEDGVATRVVSLPCWERFSAQDADYRAQVIPPDIPARLAVEAASPFGWREWVGEAGETLGVETFGASGPGGEVLAERGFTVDTLVSRARGMLTRLHSSR